LKADISVIETSLKSLFFSPRGIIIYSYVKIKYSKLFATIKAAAFFVFFLFFFGNLSCGTQDGKELKHITNSPPVISSITLLPEKPTIENELNLFIQSHDPDGDLVTYQYQWLRNDEEIIGENKNILKSRNFKKGDLIRVRVTPSDGKVNGTAFLSDAVKILNSPPLIQEVWIEPKVAYVTDRLKANVRSSDPDGDAIYYTYQWEKNGAVLNEEKGEFLERGQFKKGDLITVTVIPDDRESLGKARRSNPLIISNSPPIITSSPPTKTDGNIYTYQVTANDPDNDPVIFTLKTAPKGMEINKETSSIRWEIQKGDQGTQTIEIEASDSEGAKSIQRFTLSISLKRY
jgi:hypothetical protein